MTSKGSVEDRLELLELASCYGTVVDDRNWAALGEIFTSDVAFDITDFAGVVVTGLDSLIALMESPEAKHPAAHLVTNVFVEDLEEGRGTMRSRLLAVQGDGSVYPGEYVDTVRLEEVGWRIERRVCSYTRRHRSGR